MVMTHEEAATERARQAGIASRAAAFEREARELSTGTIDDLERSLLAIDAETESVRLAYQPARMLADASPRQHGEAFDAIVRRSDELPRLRAAVARKLATLKQDAADELARQWNASASTRDLLAAYLTAEAERLAPLAALATSYEAQTAKGASIQAMAPLPAAQAAALREFVTYVNAVCARGVKLAVSGWPASVRERLAR